MNPLIDKEKFPVRRVHPRAYVVRDALILLARCVCFPVLAILLIVEPIIRVALSAVALASILIACFFEFLTQVPNFPFLGMLGIAVASVVLLKAYYALLRMLL
jgi:CHASE2 domain-containing sensor protein